jgi:4-amino-4-deoxy-L-arabinose transferase-like glycosyltransferase
MTVEDAALTWPRPRSGLTSRTRTVAQRLRARPELVALLAVTGVLNLWGLSINGWANTYYSAAVRSMSSSWHDFLFASMDRSGLMTVDKPPLALWVQALSARVFGFHPLSLLVPQALMGVVAAGLAYDLTRRRFGRAAGFIAGFALATTPVIVGVSRHNNPDELLTLCCVAAVWFLVRGLEDGRLRWISWSAVCVGLGFETKMAVALLVVPGIATAWLWCAPGSAAQRVRRLCVAGVIGSAVALAWPLLVTLTPASDRPWISGTSDNSIWSLIFGYNGLGRVAGQTGGPAVAGGPGGGGGFGGSLFGGGTGPLRLLNAALGDQAGWMLGFAIVAGVALVALTRLRRHDPRTGWLLAVGGGFACSAIVFSFAKGIFHPYYVAFLAPYAAALVGAGAAVAFGRCGASAGAVRIVGPLLLAGGVASELAVLGQLNGSLGWAKVLLVVVGVVAVALAIALPARVRTALVAAAVAMLSAAPAIWAAQTLGHAESGTFPAGGPASASFGGPGGQGGFGRGFARVGLGFGGPGAGAPPSRAQGGVPGGLFANPTQGGFPGGRLRGGSGGFGGDSAALRGAIAYAASHGGGTIGVESQSSAAEAILSSDANVAGLGGFSGRESSVTASWIADEVAAGRLRWVLGGSGAQAQLPGDTRTGSQQAFAAVHKACRAVSLSSGSILYDCRGRASVLATALSG